MARVIETTVYQIGEHPAPEKVFDWLRNNWHDLLEWSLSEMVDSLKAFANHIGATPDWSLCTHPGRGEFVRFGFGDGDEPSLDDVKAMFDLSDPNGVQYAPCPFTGVFTDEVILDALRNDENTDLSEMLGDIEYRVLRSLRAEGEYIYSDDGLREMCEANEYEFNAEGECI